MTFIPNDKAVAAAEEPPRASLLTRLGAIASVVLGGLGWLLLAYVFAFIVPTFAEIFEKFDIKGGLPLATRVVLTLRWLGPWGFLAVPFVIVGVIVAAW